ncbi:MAG: hypothetical protein CMK59_02885 [Proteobacteria bacterium]|nr:hypothetical protein [Pseudomonadota bacterium]
MISLFSVFLACGPKEEAPAAALTEPSRKHTQPPAPLEAPSFQMPELQTASLSNGIPISLSVNSEVPLVYVWVTFNSGSWMDASEKLGLSKAAMQMLDEGAAGMSAVEISAQQKKLASTISAGAGLDEAYIQLKTLKKNIAPSVELMSKVLLSPDIPESEWEKLRKKQIQNLKAQEQDPSTISARIWNRRHYGNSYAGRFTTEETLSNISAEDIKSWVQSELTANRAQIWVGGDTSLDEIQPILEEHFGSWSTQSAELPSLPDADILQDIESTKIFLHDIPGSAQSIIRMGHAVGPKKEEKTTQLYLANMSVGGLFTSRINMNLREDKGWTYGARSYISFNHLPGIWTVRTSVVTDKTAPAVQEMVNELRAAKSDGAKPISEEELKASKGYLLGTFPLQFENPNYLLNQSIMIDRYNLPKDWLSSYSDRMRSVNLEQAQLAWDDQIDPDKMEIVIVGDKAQIEESLLNLGYSVVPVDASGSLIE